MVMGEEAYMVGGIGQSSVEVKIMMMKLLMLLIMRMVGLMRMKLLIMVYI